MVRTDIAFIRFSVLISSKEMRDAGEEPAEGILTDVGKSGLGLIVDRPLKSGTEVTIHIQHNTRDLEDVSAVIIWNNPLPTASRVIKAVKSFWRLGLKFAASATEEQKAAIEALLRTANAA